MTDPDESRDPLDLLAEEFLSRVREGQSVTPESFAAEHEEHAAALLDLLPTLLVLEQARRDRESSSTGPRRVEIPELERLGDYQIVREIGRGGMGVVFEAVQESLGRLVALKVLPQSRMFTGHQLERFQREAQIAARLHHTNIVPVFDSGEADGFQYYAMQFIDGMGLDGLVRSAAVSIRSAEAGEAEAAVALPLDEAERCRFAARVGAEIAEALQHAHEQGTMHRDIKPANLLLDQHGHVWVTDFGLAKALEDDALTHSGDVLGTLQYMAPEQFRGEYDVRSEVYALGLTLHEIAALRPAFDAGSRAELMERISNGRRQPTRRYCPRLSRDFETILERAMATDAKARYASAGDLAADLEAYLEDRPIAARRQSKRELFVYWCRRNRALSAVGAVALVAVISAAVVGWTAYLMTQDALDRAEASSKSEALARDRADDNVALALEAFEDVFDSLVGPDPLHALLAEVEEEELPDAVVALQAPVEAEDVALLQRILEFYDRYAVSNADSADLRGQAARAYRRVGAIQARLGDLPAAAGAYEKSAQLYRDTHEREAVRDLAAVLQELGEVQVRRGLARDAAGSFTKSLGVLETDLANPGRSGRWLTARGHYLVATVHSLRSGGRRPGGGRDGGRREDRQGDRREGGRREDRPGDRREGGRREDRSGDRRGRDGSRRGGRSGRPVPRPQGEGAPRPRFERSRTLAREHLRKARELLDGLLQEQPEDSECLFLTARCLLAAVRVRSRSSGETGLEELNEAIAILEKLVERFPSVDVYRFELCMALINKGRMPRGRAPEEVLEAVHSHVTELVAQQPQHPEYQSLQGRVLRDQAMRLSRTNQDEAIKLLRASLAIQEGLAERQKQRARFLESVIVTRQHLAALLLAAEQKEAAREQFALTLEQAKKLAEQGRLPRPMTGRMFASLAERLDLEAEFQELREMQSRRGR